MSVCNFTACGRNLVLEVLHVSRQNSTVPLRGKETGSCRPHPVQLLISKAGFKLRKKEILGLTKPIRSWVKAATLS